MPDFAPKMARHPGTGRTGYFHRMQRVILRGVDVASARDAIGTDRYAEGTEAARQRAVIQLHWNPSEQVLTGTVRDGNEDRDRAGEVRTVSAEFRASSGFPLRFAKKDRGGDLSSSSRKFIAFP